MNRGSFLAGSVVLLGVVLGTVTLSARGPLGGAPTGPPAVGQVAPPFALPGDDDQLHRPVNGGDRPTVVAFFCGCSLCHRTAALMQRQLARDPKARLFAVLAMNRADIAEYKRETGATFPFLFDAGGQVAQQYASRFCPVLWLLDERGRVRFSSRGRTDAPEAWFKELQHSLTSGPPST